MKLVSEVEEKAEKYNGDLVYAKPAKTHPTPFSRWLKLLRCEHFNAYRTRVMRRPYCLVLYCLLSRSM